MRSRYSLILAALVLCVAGCHDARPLKTYPVAGTVYDKAGRPLTGGSIQLSSDVYPLLRVLGDIQADGTFKLRTIFDNQQTPGAPVGEYHATVTPPHPAAVPGDPLASHKSVPPIKLPATYRIEPREMTLKIELP